MLRGNDPVAYFTDGNAVAGSPAIRADVDGRLYLFGSPRSRRGRMLDYRENIVSGDRYRAAEMKDVPYRLQNAKRYTFKVDGYKTDAELDALYAQRKAAGTLNRSRRSTATEPAQAAAAMPCRTRERRASAAAQRVRFGRSPARSISGRRVTTIG